MHEETRRRLLRAAFVLLCLAPTAGVLGWTLVRSLPVQTRRLEHRLQQQLGVAVRIGRVWHPRPGQLGFEDLVLSDLESRQPLVRLSRLDAHATDQGWRLVVPELTMPEAALASLWQVVHQRLVRDDALARRIAHVSVQQLTLERTSGQLTLYDVNWARARRPDVQRSQLFFALRHSSPSEGVRVDLHRDRSGPSPVTRLTIDTGEMSLPLSLFATALGHDWPTTARFRGRLPVSWERGGWRAEFVGQITGLNATDLSPNWTAYEVQGTATLNVNQCVFGERGLQSMQAALNVEQLVIPQALVRSLINLELLAPGPAYPGLSQQETLRLPQLGVSFAIGEMGLICRGVPDEAGLRVAAATDVGVVLLSDGFVRVNYLICALLPDHIENVYQARARLMNRLPATLPRL